MIKFYPKIRQNLLIINKTINYFKYAIGKIVLVIIGILITIQNKQNYKLIKNNKMDGFNIIMVIAIILFARLGIRLLIGYKNHKKDDD